MWEVLSIFQIYFKSFRITPTYVGSTIMIYRLSLVGGDHPHVCGDHPHVCGKYQLVL